MSELNKNSMLYWWPRVMDIDIPKPKTEIIELGMTHDEVFGIIYGEGDLASATAWNERKPALIKAINRMGVPAFLRTDYTSGKHDWEKSCFYDGSNPITRHISELVEYSSICDLTIEALVVREYIPMESGFTAFSGKMPVNPERRYFVDAGAVVCHHYYWVSEAIEESDERWAERLGRSRLTENWRQLLADMNTEDVEEIVLLSGYAEQVASQVDGYWSVDFCKARDGRWIFIDMAEGEKSWHPDCELNPRVN